MNDVYTVRFSKRVIKKLKKLPVHIVLKLQAWIEAVMNDGLNKTKEICGYHDEPLKGDRVGHRSIRLNKAYRAIYIIKNTDEVSIAEIIEVTKHEY